MGPYQRGWAINNERVVVDAMAGDNEGIVDRIKEEAEETKEGIQETYEDLPGRSAGQKVKGVFKEAVDDAKDARHVNEDEAKTKG